MREDEEQQRGTENRESNPNSSGPSRLEGDMGLSSERSGPFEGIEGTGSLASAKESTDGESPTYPDADRAHPQAPAEGADDPEARQGSGKARATGVDRTVGEDNPASVPSHPNHPEKNPGHSHG